MTEEVKNQWEELNSAIQEVLRSGQFILGEHVESFEQKAAEHIGVNHAVGVNSGTDAIIIGLRSLGIEPGDEVIAPSFTFFATAEAISMVGAEPVFVDIEPRSFNLDPAKVEEAITRKTKAILPVHLFGCPAAMAQIWEIARENDLYVLEDCAQSFGAEYAGNCIGCWGENCPDDARGMMTGNMTGSLGQVGAFSFYPTKNLGAYGDGGLITTDDTEVAETARMLRKHGGENKYHNEVLGYNSRLDAIQAAILEVLLEKVPEFNQRRREIAQRYSDEIREINDIVTPQATEGHVFHQYTIRVLGDQRDELKESLQEDGISSKVFYPVPCHQLPVYEDQDHGQLPESEQASGQVLSLPIWPQMEEDTQRQVIESIKKYFN
ncbi:dTDP-4-amino-4,6-dideoxygalactose transaminase [Salinibacter ruber]|nr:DegT/DnrJ/EryC1/StrS family aminotransferase [Salinibacter ruber]MCS3856502.1 dTDP-4-amino-4,6-dideoxygalactose transaminase [Salinibacter ruber]